VTVVYYISGHGFGHASRSTEVVKALLERHPRWRIVLRTSAARWFLEASLGSAVQIEPVETDTGVVQIDSLRLDEDETARTAARFHADFEDRIDVEVAALSRHGAALVIGDIPPIAFAAAHRAGLPSVALANFTWDWIYSGYPQFEQLAPGVVDAIGRAYSHATLALRLPFTGGFDTMSAVAQDIPLIARKSTHTRESARQALGLDDRLVVLASFGGHGLRLPYEQLSAKNTFTLIVTGREAGGESAAERQLPGPKGPGLLRRITYPEMARRGLKYEDLVAASDVVVTKAGYGIVSECIANGAALLYAPRGRVREHDVFVSELPRVLRCRPISSQELMSGHWQPAVEAVLSQPRVRETPINGAPEAARLLSEHLQLGD
jgi:L-arabinokinase